MPKRHPMRILSLLARRFVAGETMGEAIRVARCLNSEGLSATLSLLGEDVQEEFQAKMAAEEYQVLLNLIHDGLRDTSPSGERLYGFSENGRHPKTNISLKLSHLGTAISLSLCEENLARVLEEAKRLNSFVRLDMEGSDWTQKTLEVFYKLQPRYLDHVGVVIQAYLYRSQRDIDELIRWKARVRLCKGAYQESPQVALQKSHEINQSFDQLAERLLLEGNHPAIATHDEDRIRCVIEFALRNNISKDRFEFQMLYGLRRDLWMQLIREGYRVRIYVPFGTHWFSYFYRRLRERKENVYFLLRNLLKG